MNAATFWDEGSPAHRAGLWLGHHFLRFGPWMFAATAVMVLATRALPEQWAPVGAKVVEVLLLAAAGMGVCAIGVHERYGCPLDVDAVPWGNPDEAVRRAGWQLRMAHQPWLLAVIGLPVAAMAAGYETWLSTALWAAMLGVLGVVLAAVVAHDRLQPWCPQCRHGGGGGGRGPQVAPEPDPVGTVSR